MRWARQGSRAGGLTRRRYLPAQHAACRLRVHLIACYRLHRGLDAGRLGLRERSVDLLARLVERGLRVFASQHHALHGAVYRFVDLEKTR